MAEKKKTQISFVMSQLEGMKGSVDLKGRVSVAKKSK